MKIENATDYISVYNFLKSNDTEFLKPILEKAFKSYTSLKKRPTEAKKIYFTIPQLLDIIINVSKKSYEILSVKRRFPDVVEWRHIFYYMCLHNGICGSETAGDIFNQDHATAMHGRDNVKKFIEIFDPTTLQRIELIEEELKKIKDENEI